MRKVIVGEFLSLDGVMQAPRSPDEGPAGGFRARRLADTYVDDVAARAVLDATAASGGYLLGRRTYQTFAAFWPSITDESDPAIAAVAAAMNSLPKYVALTTLQAPLAWSNSTLIKGDVAEEVAKVKQQPGKDLQAIGSGDLVRR